MRKYFILFLLAIASTFSIQAQLSVSFTGGSADPGGQVEVDVIVADFENLFGVQYSINWDSLVLEYTDIINVTMDLPGFDENAIGVPDQGSVNLDPGEMTVSWFQSNTHSLPDDTRLFTIVFTGQNVPCDSTDVAVTGTPLAIEVTDENFANIGITSTPQTIYINGVGCSGSGGGDELKFYVENETVVEGESICIPILMDNFIDFNGGQGKLGWDPTVLTFTGIQNIIPGSFNDNQNNVDMGMYNFLWENLDPGNPVTLPDGTTFFEICFDVIGETGEMTDIDLESFASDWGFTDETGAEPPLVLCNGKITVVDTPPDPVILTISSITIDQNGNGCVGVSVENFENILSAQGTFAFNSVVADYTGTQGFGALVGLDANDFNQINENNVRMTWNAPGGSSNGESVPDGTELFQICFDGVGACDAVSLIDFIDVAQLEIEFVQIVAGSPVTIDHEINAGSITINCVGGGDCMITGKSDVLCNGDNTGSIQVTINTNVPDCQCVWYKDGSSTPFMTLAAPNCDLNNVGAGVYRLELVCDGNVEDTCEETINQPNAILINGMVTNIGCAQMTGSIVLNPEGGVDPYTYAWNDPGMSMTKDISNLPAGTYTVTVTDSNNCPESRSFEITDMVTPLSVDTAIVDVACFGDMTGSIALAVTGGCPDNNGDYSIMPSNLTGLGAGNYTITVSDFANPVNSITLNVTIGQPAAALDITGTTTPSSGSDGTITTMITGGTPNYTITWTGGIPNGTMNPTGLAPNTYTMTVVDQNGCATSEVFIVPGGGTDPAFTDPAAIDAACNGDENGVINITITAGDGPFTISVVNANSEIVATATSDIPGPVSLTGLGAGMYNVIVSDSEGNETTKPVTINEPSSIQIDFTVDCANGSSTDGSIDVTVDGGVGDFMYEWSNGDFTEDLDNIGVGNYSLLVEDGNGCQAIVNSIRVQDCNPMNCYEAIHIITPNGDGINDNFVINCVMQNDTRLTIYDRWGNEVFTQQNYDNTWSGIDTDNEELRESAYMWVLEVDFSDNRQEVFKGTVTVLRAD